jgi:8-oxo-dGTP diphosphatase
MAYRDGDGWINCDCGGKHWGLHGAAGLLLVRDKTILMQHRAPWVHNGDSWGIPGGARDSHETVIQAALREAVEEVGISSDHLTTGEIFIDDHGPWSYQTVIAKAHPELVAHEANDESKEVAWVAFSAVGNKNLHPSFANTWPQLLVKLEKL